MKTLQLITISDWKSLYENNRTRELKRLDWVPVPNRMDGDGYTELLDHPNGAAHLGAWTAILQIASRCDVRGTLMRDGAGPHTARSLSRISRIPALVFEEVIPRLRQIGWITLSSIKSDDCKNTAVECDNPAPDRDEVPMEGNGREWNGSEVKNIPSSAAPSEALGDLPFLELVPSTPRAEKLATQQERWFELEFWPNYWRRVSKAEALKAFRQQATSEPIKNQILEALEEHSRYYRGKDSEHQPHASTWLRQRRYLEPAEIPATARGQPGSTESLLQAVQRREALDEAIRRT